MKYLIDIDNTICKTNGDDYEHAEPYPKRIAKFNKLYDKGHKIIYWTARGEETGKNWDELTRTQLRKWKVKYHALGHKPYADFYIDDKAINIKNI